MGKYNVTSLQLVSPTAISIRIPGLKTYGRIPCLWLIHSPTGRFLRVVILIIHAESLYHFSTSDKTKQMDWCWNMATALSGLTAVNMDYFSWKISRSKKVDENPDWKTFLSSTLDQLFRIEAWESRNQQTISADDVSSVVKRYIRKEEIAMNDQGSCVAQVWRHVRKKGGTI